MELVALTLLVTGIIIGANAWQAKREKDYVLKVPPQEVVELTLPRDENNAQAIWTKTLPILAGGKDPTSGTTSLIFTARGTNGRQTPTCDAWIGCSAYRADSVQSTLRNSFRDARIRSATDDCPLTHLATDYQAMLYPPKDADSGR